MEGLELFRAGKLKEAISACVAQVKSDAKAIEPRDLLVQLYCFMGDHERADNHLNVLGTQCPERENTVSLIRQLLRAAEARQQFYHEGRLPEFLERPPEYLQLHLRASAAIREGDEAETAQLLAEAEKLRPKPRGKCDGAAFSDLRDIDDLTSSFLEAFTTNGKYYWLPFERVIRVVLHPAESPIDILWRRAQIQVQDGPTGVVYLPQLYDAASGSDDELLRVGLAADWLGGEGKPVRGLGHRMLYVDSQAKALNDINSLEFDHSPT